MSHNRTSSNFHRQQGYLIPVAIFILVVMASLALTIARYTSQSSIATVQEILNVQAFYAAESGAQFAMNAIFFDATAAVTTVSTVAQCAAVPTPVTFSGTGLELCSAAVTCSSDSVSNPGTVYFTIRSTGTCGTNPLSAQRTVEIASFIE